MATININITGINRGGSLILKLDDGSDAELVIAQRGNYIQWVIKPDSGVATITDIRDTSKTNVFGSNSQPHRESGSQNWEGRISQGLSGLPKTETYNINYTKTGDSGIYNHDPRIQVRS